ncbi:MAG: hypothetical protein QOC88_3492 [Mycobacterium sp.]|nr:hypothetical protein [Mycobacterium sp.]
MAEKSLPRYMNSAFADVFIKWMSRINTFFISLGSARRIFCATEIG